MMKLIHNSLLIGIIKNAYREEMHMSGDIELTEAADRYLEMFAFIVGPKDPYKALPFPESDIWGWTIEDDSDKTREVIGCPAVSNNDTVIMAMGQRD